VKTVRDIGEDALIDRLIQLVPRDRSASAGPGDDCAVIDRGTGFSSLQLLKTDALVEKIHFLSDAPPRKIGWKSVARVISDFAAMGGKPEHFLITLALPQTTPVSWIEDVYRGIGECLEKFGGVVAGGETSSVPENSAAVISIAATGSVEREHVVLRSTSKPGDAIFVTGQLGGSIFGKHLDFTPRVEEAAWLVSNFKPSAMMDLSDGLAKDLNRLANASNCGFRIERAEIPITTGCTIAQALGDGEDFELLFTIDQEKTDDLLAAWPEHFPKLSLVGKMVETGFGEKLSGGWEHFNSLGIQET